MTSGSSSTASTSQLRILGRGPRGDAGAQPEEQRAPRRGMQQDRQQRLPRVGEQRRAAAFLLPVVDVQRRDAARVLDTLTLAIAPSV